MIFKVSLNKSETWKWKNWDISWSLSKESTSEKKYKNFINSWIWGIKKPLET